MRLIVVKWDTSWLRETVFNDRVSSSRASFSRFVLRSSGKTEESQGGGREDRERERLSSEGMTISYSHLEDSLNMHETIAYLMQLAEASLFSFSLSAYSSVIFFIPFLSLHIPGCLATAFVALPLSRSPPPPSPVCFVSVCFSIQQQRMVENLL